MGRMSLEEKVGQLFLVFFEGPNLSPALSEMIRKYHIGGIVLFARSGNIENPDQLARLIGDAQGVAVREGAGCICQAKREPFDRRKGNHF